MNESCVKMMMMTDNNSLPFLIFSFSSPTCVVCFPSSRGNRLGLSQTEVTISDTSTKASVSASTVTIHLSYIPKLASSDY